MLFLFLCMAFSVMHQPGILRDSYRSLYSKMKRTYSDISSDLLTRMLCGFFRVGTIAMCLYASFFTGEHFSGWVYLLVVVAVAITEGLRWALSQLCTFTFTLKRKMDIPESNYSALWILTSVALFFVTLLIINFGTTVSVLLLLFLVIANYIAVIAWKLIAVFLSEIHDVIYIALYILTLEVLPFTMLAVAAHALL